MDFGGRRERYTSARLPRHSTATDRQTDLLQQLSTKRTKKEVTLSHPHSPTFGKLKAKKCLFLLMRCAQRLRDSASQAESGVGPSLRSLESPP